MLSNEFGLKGRYFQYDNCGSTKSSTIMNYIKILSKTLFYFNRNIQNNNHLFRHFVRFSIKKHYFPAKFSEKASSAHNSQNSL